MPDTKVETLPTVTLELRFGHGADGAGRQGKLVASGPVDEEWPTWLPHLKPAVSETGGGDHVYFYRAEPGSNVWELVWSAPVEPAVVTALEDLGAARRRRDAGDLEATRAALEAEIRVAREGLAEIYKRADRAEQQAREERREQAELTRQVVEEQKQLRAAAVEESIRQFAASRDGLAKEREQLLAAHASQVTHIDAQRKEREQLLAAHEQFLAAQRTEREQLLTAQGQFLDAQRKEREQVLDETLAMRRKLEASRATTIAHDDTLSTNHQQHLERLIGLESVAIENAGARLTTYHDQVNTFIEAVDGMKKNKMLALQSAPAPAGWDLIGTAVAKRIEQGALESAGKGAADLVKSIRDMIVESRKKTG